VGSPIKRDLLWPGKREQSGILFVKKGKKKNGKRRDWEESRIGGTGCFPKKKVDIVLMTRGVWIATSSPLDGRNPGGNGSRKLCFEKPRRWMKCRDLRID